MQGKLIKLAEILIKLRNIEALNLSLECMSLWGLYIVNAGPFEETGALWSVFTQ